MANPRPRRTRVAWTGEEKIELIERAHAIQRGHPDLAGLPLLRAAIKTFPEGRRRHVISVAQAPWFELGMKRRAEAIANVTETAIEHEVVEIKRIVGKILEILEMRA